MADPAPNNFAARNVRYFRTLALILGVGIIAALVLGLGNAIPGLQVIEIGTMTRTLLLALFVIAVVLAMFLLRVGVIFDVEKKVDELFATEAAALEESRKRIEDAFGNFRNDVRREFADLKEGWNRERQRLEALAQEANGLALKALNAAEAALARINELSKEPAYRSTIEQLLKDIAALAKDVQALRTADKVNSPLLADLKERVVALETGQKKLNVRVDETLETIERRDMESSAIRQTLDQELANLKKRETLLLVKQKELSDQNMNFAAGAQRTVVAFAPGEERQHVMNVPGVTPAHASRLNIMGIITVPQLIAAHPDAIAPRLDVLPDQVREWQSAAKVMRIKGIGPDVAHALVKAGVRNVGSLASETPEGLVNKIRDAAKGGKFPGVDNNTQNAKKWIDAAKRGDVDNGNA
jgi:hypothetical protein